MVLLVSLLAVPGLMGLALVLEWLERVFARQEVASAIARLIATEAEVERLETAIAHAAQALFPRS